MTFNASQFELEFETLSPWWPDLAEKLVNDKWTFLRDVGVTEKNYSTGFFLENKEVLAKEIIEIRTLLHNDVPCVKKIEFLSDASEYILSQNGLEFYSKADFLRFELADVVFSAFEKIRKIPSLFESTELLARNIIFLKPQDNFSDISYSSPKIPFTIFISIPPEKIENIELRVAESIIHECMHLQLTLLEERMPLIVSNTERHFSPWKREWRNSSGILHALYVFTVILHWIRAFPPNQENISYIKGRVSQILSEVSQIENIKESNDLTPIAKMITRYLLSYLPTDGAI